MWNESPRVTNVMKNSLAMHSLSSRTQKGFGHAQPQQSNAASKSGFARTETTLVTSAQTLEYPCPCRESAMSRRRRWHGARDAELHLSYGIAAMKDTWSILSDAVAAAPSFTAPWPPMVGPRLINSRCSTVAASAAAAGAESERLLALLCATRSRGMSRKSCPARTHGSVR
jgi:hypothetical protein